VLELHPFRFLWQGEKALEAALKTQVCHISTLLNQFGFLILGFFHSEFFGYSLPRLRGLDFAENFPTVGDGVVAFAGFFVARGGGKYEGKNVGFWIPD
jgi:hypothetical protein